MLKPGDHIIYHKYQKNGNLPLKAVFIQCIEEYLYILDIKEDKEINIPNVRWSVILEKNEYIELDKQYYRNIKLNQLFNEKI
jgi:hypothetical protein